jgi:two-component system, chemotaxis family, CheB/CheR fusion protein
MNEELQSTNEELETSKEEIQSVNEELQTVNHELGAKVEQLNQANYDLRNLFESTQVAVIFLDLDLLIRIYTPAVASIFNLIATDRGRPLTDIAHQLEYGSFEQDIRGVIAGAPPIESRVAKRDGSTSYLMRILPYQAGGGETDGALLVFVDITEAVRNERQLRTLVQELNHRVRNILAVVSAIANQTVARHPSPADATASFLGRVQALGRSHSLLARERWGDVALADLIRAELEPHMDGDPGRLRQDGPDVQLKPKAALTMGMMIHELATNAVKHGALSVPEGKVAVTWAREGLDGTAALVLRWAESGGPTVEPPRRNGFGTQLLSRQVQHEWGGVIDTEYAPDGVRVTLTLPENDQLFSGPHGEGS